MNPLPQQGVLAFMMGSKEPTQLPKTKAMLENVALNTAVLPGVLGEIKWDSGNPDAENAVFDAMVKFHTDELKSRGTIVSVLQSAVTTSTVAARCVIPLVDEVCTLLNWLAMGATASASSSAFITHIDTIISVIVAPGYDFIGFLGTCWMYLSDDIEGTPIPEVVSRVFGAACNRRTVGLIFYAILLRVRTNRANALAVDVAIPAVAPVAPAPAVGQGMPDPAIMASIQNAAMTGFRWVSRYLCSIPEFIIIGLGGTNPITPVINKRADGLICGWMAGFGNYAREKFDRTPSEYLHQKHLLSVFAPAFINDRRQLDKAVFDILWAQEAERVLAATMLHMMNAIRERDPLRIHDLGTELAAQSQCREWLLVVRPHCMDGMLTRDQLEAHASSYRQQASDRNYDPSSMGSQMAQPSSQTEGSQKLSGEDVLLLTHVQATAGHLLTNFCESETIQGGKLKLAELGGFFFADDWGAWNAETGVKPKKYTEDEMAQLLAAPADLRTFFEKIINYIAKHVHAWLVEHPERFGEATGEAHAYKKWSWFLDSLLRISILLKNQYKIDFDSRGLLILSLNTDVGEPAAEEWWLKCKPAAAEYAENRPFMKRYVFGLIGTVVSGVIGVMNDVTRGFSRSDDDDIESACEIILGPVLAEPAGSGEALAADDVSRPTSLGQLLICGTNLSNWGWNEEMRGNVVPDAAAGDAAAAAMDEKVTASRSALGAEAAAAAAARRQNATVVIASVKNADADDAAAAKAAEKKMKGGKSRKNSKKTTRRNKGRKSSNTAKKSQQQRARNSIRRRRSSRKGRK